MAIISFQKCIKSPCIDGNIELEAFYQQVQNGHPDAKVMHAVKQIRNAESKEIITEIKKTMLPAYTISTQFKQKRKKNGGYTHSNRIAIDIDHIQNDVGYVRDELMNLPYVEFSALSVSGNGVFAVVKILHADKHHEHFNMLKNELEQYNIYIDAQCRDVTRLRAYSYDPEAKWNKEAIAYSKLPAVRKHKSIAPYKTIATGSKTTREQVEALIQHIEAHRIDITADYNDWIKIGFALCTEFGESGREYFHRISQFYVDYNFVDVNKNYDKLLVDNRGSISIKSLFYIFKKNTLVAF